jgi:hypothetical protein
MIKFVKDFWEHSSVDDKVFAFILLGFGFPMAFMLFVFTWYGFFSMIGSFF